MRFRRALKHHSRDSRRTGQAWRAAGASCASCGVLMRQARSCARCSVAANVPPRWCANWFSPALAAVPAGHSSQGVSACTLEMNTILPHRRARSRASPHMGRRESRCSACALTRFRTAPAPTPERRCASTRPGDSGMSIPPGATACRTTHSHWPRSNAPRPTDLAPLRRLLARWLNPQAAGGPPGHSRPLLPQPAPTPNLQPMPVAAPITSPGWPTRFQPIFSHLNAPAPTILPPGAAPPHRVPSSRAAIPGRADPTLRAPPRAAKRAACDPPSTLRPRQAQGANP